jgi:FKBP-type peptidyl-prolyl cis-trans isomerase SlyD
MTNQDTPLVVKKDLVVSLDYKLQVDGEVIDSSEQDPIQFLQGHGEIIPGLEKELYGMKVGDHKDVVVPASQGYGEFDPEAFAEIPRTEFPKDFPLEPDVEVQLRDEDGEVVDAFIESLDDKMVYLNLNHPLAGKELHFSVTVAALRDPTPEELEHGHVHSDEEEEFEDDEDFDDDDDDEDYDDDDEGYDDEDEDDEDEDEDD